MCLYPEEENLIVQLFHHDPSKKCFSRKKNIPVTNCCVNVALDTVNEKGKKSNRAQLVFCLIAGSWRPRRASESDRVVADRVRCCCSEELAVRKMESTIQFCKTV